MQVLITVGVLSFDNLQDAHNEALRLFKQAKEREIKVMGVKMEFWSFNNFNEAIQNLQVLINVGVPLNIIETYCKQVGTKFNLTWQQVKLFAEFGGYVDELSVF